MLFSPLLRLPPSGVHWGDEPGRDVAPRRRLLTVSNRGPVEFSGTAEGKLTGLPAQSARFAPD